MNREIVYNAIEVLRNNTPVKAEWKEPDQRKGEGGGILIIKMQKNKYLFKIEVKKALRNIHMPKLAAIKGQHHNLVVVADVIYPNICKQLQERQINYIDTTGNIFIHQDELLLLLYSRKADKPLKNNIGRAFNKAGLKFIYYLLTEEHFLNRTYREMAEICETALGNINYIIKDLEEQNFLKKKIPKKVQINDRKALMAAWVENYEGKLKAHCLVGTFRFQHPDAIKNWKNLKIDNTKTQWGGEPAANILTNYLKPATLTLYTDEKRSEMIKNLRLIPDAGGNVHLYTRFWKKTEVQKETVHPLIIYADLVNIGDPRTDELANMIFDEYLKEES